MDTEARKRRRKRNMYRNKLKSKEAEMKAIVARMTFLQLTKAEANYGGNKTYEFAGLERQKEVVTRKLARLGDILASLSPAFCGEKGNTS